ncbi:MAG TPA: sulfur transferase domain-containing protein, partial [Solimonas sp.]|nr:sulfur transferase domain-containing protein [Solimonas sp.]
SHPLPSQLRAAAKFGIRTIINLRGVDPNIASNRLSWEACERYGLRLVHFPLFSRQAPTREEILGINELFKQVEKPVLLHCKSGADRAGLASALYLMLQADESVEVALRQLSLLRFGHIRQAKAGILDHFFECYRQHHEQHGTPFEEWVRRHYSRHKVETSFHHNRWINKLADWLLRRE